MHGSLGLGRLYPYFLVLWADNTDPPDVALQFAINAAQDLLLGVEVDGDALVLRSSFESALPALQLRSSPSVDTCRCHGSTAPTCRSALRDWNCVAQRDKGRGPVGVATLVEFR